MNGTFQIFAFLQMRQKEHFIFHKGYICHVGWVTPLGLGDSSTTNGSIINELGNEEWRAKYTVGEGNQIDHDYKNH